MWCGEMMIDSAICTNGEARWHLPIEPFFRLVRVSVVTSELLKHKVLRDTCHYVRVDRRKIIEKKQHQFPAFKCRVTPVLANFGPMYDPRAPSPSGGKSQTSIALILRVSSGTR
jgi:hypothetical protein